jgi:hypothetical protein
MTLVLSLLTPNYVLQVSDQRITRLPDLRLLDDKRVKAVLFNNIASWAYTGLAELPRSDSVENARNEPASRIPTHQWLAELLTLPASYDELHALLAQEAGTAITRLRLPVKYRQLAFVGTFWATNESGDGIEPMFVQVWNYGDGRSVGDFNFVTAKLKAGDSYGLHASKALPRAVDRRVLRGLESALHQRHLGPASAARLLIEAVRETGRRYDKTVGRSVIVSCLPRIPVTTMLSSGNWKAKEGSPDLNYVTFQRIGAKGHRTTGSPIVVFGKAIFSQLQTAHPLTFQFDNAPPRLK